MLTHFMRALTRLLHSAAFCFLAVLASCELVPVPGEGEPTGYSVEFRIGDGENAADTRATGIQASDETRVNRWTLCVFRVSDGMPAAAGSSASSAAIVRTLPAGAYRAVAVVNPPTTGPGAFDPGASLTENALEAQTAYLADNAVGSLEMYGVKSFTLGAASASVAIPVSRLVSKVVLQKVTLRLSNTALTAYPFTLDAVYLDNVPSRTAWGTDPAFGNLPADRALWYNPMGWHKTGACTSPACPDLLLGERQIGTVIAQGGSHQTEYAFYTVPNPTSSQEDTRSATWAKRATRLVIEARLGSQTQYYVASLPEMARNHSYVIEEAVITGLGAADPETETPNSLELLFSVVDDGWEDGGTVVL